MDFINALEQTTNLTVTENGAVANRSTLSKVLDFFANGGGLRLNKQTEASVNMFKQAYSEDKTLALKVLFYLRDVRGGQGEREVFRLCIKWLANTYPQDIKFIVELIPEFGRWDDMYAFHGTSLFESAMNVVAAQLVKDMASENPSLCAKWMKSENTSSKQSRALARATAAALKLKLPAYRKMLSSLRKKIDLLETKISFNKWDGVDYSKIPSQASMKYKKAFTRHDEARWTGFMTKVASGEVKMNASTLFPHQIIGKLAEYAQYGVSNSVPQAELQFAEAAWKSLPDYFKGAQEDMLVVADVSGSMQGDPMNVSIALALYAAEHNQGAWNGKFMTFSKHPALVKVTGDTIADKVFGISRAQWDMNTDVEAMFMAVLTAAKGCGKMVKRIVIVSDMEFDNCATAGEYGRPDQTLFDNIRARYARAGFEMPGVTFWNVRSRPDAFPTTGASGNVQLVSGCSASTFEHIIKGDFPTPYDFMLSVINTPRYESIAV